MANTDALPAAWPLVTMVTFVTPVKPNGNTCSQSHVRQDQLGGMYRRLITGIQVFTIREQGLL